TTLQVIALDPTGPAGPPDAAGTSWTFCRTPKPLGENRVVAPDCLAPAPADAVGSPVEVALPADACRLFGPSPPQPAPGAPPTRAALPPLRPAPAPAGPGRAAHPPARPRRHRRLLPADRDRARRLARDRPRAGQLRPAGRVADRLARLPGRLPGQPEPRRLGP